MAASILSSQEQIYFSFLLLSLKSRLPLQDLGIIHRIQWGIIQEKETKSKYGLGNDSRQE